MSAAATSQRLAAMKRANEIRVGRSKILQPLRRGDTVIGDVDLDAPELQSMRLIDFLATLRYKRSRSRVTYKPPATYMASRIVNLLGCNGARRIGDLTERQKRELVRIVQETVAAQRSSTNQPSLCSHETDVTK